MMHSTYYRCVMIKWLKASLHHIHLVICIISYAKIILTLREEITWIQFVR